jgi:hypothetical protein
LDEGSDFSSVVLEIDKDAGIHAEVYGCYGDTAPVPSARFGVVARVYCAADGDIWIDGGRWSTGRC